LTRTLAPIFGRHDADHRDLRRVPCQRVGDDGPVLTEKHDRAQAVPHACHEVIKAGALGQATGNPHHRGIGRQGGRGRMRVGGLGVVDIGNAVNRVHGGHPVRVGLEGMEHIAYGVRCAAAGVTSVTAASSAAADCRLVTKARSASTPSTTPSCPTAGTSILNPTARAPSTTSASRTNRSVTGSATLYTHATLLPS